jgi:hypothetical protein
MSVWAYNRILRTHVHACRTQEQQRSREMLDSLSDKLLPLRSDGTCYVGKQGGRYSRDEDLNFTPKEGGGSKENGDARAIHLLRLLHIVPFLLYCFE